MSMTPSITPALFNALVEALTIILPLTSPADVGLKFFFREHPKLGHRDRGVIAEAIYAVLRHRRTLEHLVPDGKPRNLALLALMRVQGLSQRELAPLLRACEDQWLAGIKAGTAPVLPLAVEAELPDRVETPVDLQMSPYRINKRGRTMTIT